MVKSKYLFLCLAFPMMLMAEEKAEKTANEAAPLLQKFVEQVRAANSLQVRIKAEVQAQEGTFVQHGREIYDLAWESGGKLGLVLKSPTLGPSIASDGQKTLGYFPTSNTFLSADAPADLSDLMNDQGWVRIIGAIPFIDLIIFKDGLDEVVAAVSKGQDMGPEKINGQECRLVQFTLPVSGRPIPWKMWLTTGDKPAMLKLQPDLAGFGRETLAAIWYFDSWKFDEAVPAEAYKLTIPTEARAEGSDNHVLLDKPAPALKLELLGGGQMDLEQHKGKDVVVLDFWATWCKPCRQAMPLIDKVVGEFPAGVMLYAVNLRDTAQAGGREKIEDFLKQSGLKVKVALDKEGKSADAYAAESIPQTVVIDKFGTVRHVHIGFGRNTAAALKAEIAGLIEEKTAPVRKQKKLDLAPLAVKFNPNHAKAGDKLTAQVEIENRGTDELAPGEALLRLVAGEVQLYLGILHEKIPAGQKISLKIPEETWYLVPQKAGKYQFQLMIDPDEKVRELDEKNNLLQGELEVK